MAASLSYLVENELVDYAYGDVDDHMLARAAEALYLWRWPKASWFLDLAEQTDRAIDYFFEWAELLLEAGLSRGVDGQEWDEEAAGRVYYHMSHEGCLYESDIDYRWPQVGWWYEHVAVSVLDYAVNQVSVDNTAVLPIAFRSITGKFD